MTTETMTDTHQRTTPAELDALASKKGFRELYAETHGEQNDVFKIWGHRDGFLLVTDTYGDLMNTVQVYYNWIPDEKEAVYRLFSSGGFTADGVWSGHYDGRCGLFAHLAALDRLGRVLPQWKDTPFLWLLNYTETRECGYGRRGMEFSKEVNQRKLAALPPACLGAMGMGCA